jgi:hypothetical protein
MLGMSRVEPTQEELKDLFDYHDGMLYCKQTGRHVGISESQDYFYVVVFGIRFKLHRLIWIYHHGEIPEGIEIDHRKTKSNLIDNLRLATRSQNAMNRAKTSGTSKYKGVHLKSRNNRWIAQINKPGTKARTELGAFKTENEAAICYNEAAIKYFGEFACLNEIEN